MNTKITWGGYSKNKPFDPDGENLYDSDLIHFPSGAVVPLDVLMDGWWGLDSDQALALGVDTFSKYVNKIGYMISVQPHVPALTHIKKLKENLK